MKDTDQIAAEAVETYFATPVSSKGQRYDLRVIIESAIEEAIQAFLCHDAAHASEQGEDKKCLEEAWMDALAEEVQRYNGIPHLGRKQLRFREVLAEYLSQHPISAVADASEQGVWRCVEDGDDERWTRETVEKILNASSGDGKQAIADAHNASEQGADTKRLLLSARNVLKRVGDLAHSGEISAGTMIKIRAFALPMAEAIDAALSQRPAPATASEPLTEAQIIEGYSAQ